MSEPRKDNPNWVKTTGPKGGTGYRKKNPNPTTFSKASFTNWEGKEVEKSGSFAADDFDISLVSARYFTDFHVNGDWEDTIYATQAIGEHLGADVSYIDIEGQEEGETLSDLGEAFHLAGYELGITEGVVKIRKYTSANEALPKPDIPWEEAKGKQLVLASDWSVGINHLEGSDEYVSSLHMYIEDEENQFGGQGLSLKHSLDGMVHSSSEEARKFHYENGFLQIFVSRNK